MEGAIKLVDALAYMQQSREPFTLRFVRLDRGRKTGGQITEWQRVRLSRRQDAPAAAEAPVPAETSESASRMPRHFQNATRNVVVGESSQRRKVHIWLLLALNGQRIVLG